MMTAGDTGLSASFCRVNEMLQHDFSISSVNMLTLLERTLLYSHLSFGTRRRSSSFAHMWMTW